MGHEQMPDDRLKRLAVRRDVRWIHGWHNHAGGRLLCGVTAVASDNADDRRPDFFGELNGADQIRADVFFKAAAADGENQQAVFRTDTTTFEPFRENRRPAAGRRGAATR